MPRSGNHKGFVRGVREKSIRLSDSNSWRSTTALLSDFSETIPHARLKGYLSKAGGNKNLANELYSWDLDISSALWRHFNVLEIGLRSALSLQLVNMSPSVNWWLNENLLLQSEKSKIAALGDKNGTPFSQDEIITRLTLGFWASLLSKKYHQRLWQAGLEDAFPNFQGKRRDFHMKLERLRKLRNRIAHHEPIIDREINLDLNLIVEVCGTLDRRIESWIGADKRVDKILARYPTI